MQNTSTFANGTAETCKRSSESDLFWLENDVQWNTNAMENAVIATLYVPARIICISLKKDIMKK